MEEEGSLSSQDSGEEDFDKIYESHVSHVGKQKEEISETERDVKESPDTQHYTEKNQHFQSFSDSSNLRFILEMGEVIWIFISDCIQIFKVFWG